MIAVAARARLALARWLMALLALGGCAAPASRESPRKIATMNAYAPSEVNAPPIASPPPPIVNPAPPLGETPPLSQAAPPALLTSPDPQSLRPISPASTSGARVTPVGYNAPLAGPGDPSQAVVPLPPVDQIVYTAPVEAGPGGVVLAARQQPIEEIPSPGPDERRPRLEDRLRMPTELPGATAAPIQLPPFNIENPQSRSKLIDELFPEPPSLMKLATPRIEIGGAPMTLRQLQDIALQNSPLLPQASGDVTAALGDAVQRGTHPNPIIGYEADTVGSFGTRNYQGVYGSQTIKTAGKLGLARAAANLDAMNAQLAYRKTRIQLLADVRNGYFDVLVAQESVAVNSALVRFTTEAYRIQVDKLKAGSGAGYEPAQLRTLAVQAKSALVQAQNRYISAWKQLAATVGTPDLPPARLEGRADMPVPILNYDSVLAYVLNNHPDVQAGRNSASQAMTNLRLQQVTPVPDLVLYGTFQKDYTDPALQRTSYNVQFGVPVPIWDRNRGNIMNAEGGVRRANVESRRAQLALTQQVADAFERLETNRVQAEFFREQVLPDLARAYRGVYQRHQQESGQVGFSDIIVAQQNLAVAVGAYITALGAQWDAVADLSNLMQLDDLWVLYGANRPPDIEPQQPPAPEASPK